MKPIYIRPLPTHLYRKTRDMTVEEFFDKHKPVVGPTGGIVVLIPSPIKTEHDLAVVLAKIQEAARA